MHRFFFWTDHGTPQISRASMDGSNRITVVNVDIEWPNGMDIDYVGEDESCL